VILEDPQESAQTNPNKLEIPKCKLNYTQNSLFSKE
jgi:hypothetical protein